MSGREPPLRAVLSPRRRRSPLHTSPPPSGLAVLVTCEHGGHEVPARYAALFVGADAVLASHRGWDPGALGLAGILAAALAAPLRAATVTRLLVDLNRSPHHPRVFSEFTRVLPPEERRALLAVYHTPYREAVDADVARLGREERPVLHLGIHTFTPVLNGRVRRPDLALLYDPSREGERRLCDAWVRALRVRVPDRAGRRNDPYRGASDGLTTWLRGRHGPDRYLGVEVEVNQRLLEHGGQFAPDVAGGLLAGLRDALVAMGWPAPLRAPY